jgi:hypothetical protein
MAWEVFAVYDATVDFPYIQQGANWSSFEPLLETVYSASIYDYGFKAAESDKLLTLSTCTFSVPGHEAMPITAQNDYRFVIMARLVGPEAPIKKAASFTLNEKPLAPDDLPPYSHLTQDAFMIDGVLCGNSRSWYNDCIDFIEPIKPDKLIPVGKIERSNLNEIASDGEAHQLPVGTVILQDPDYTDMYVADVGGDMIPYIAQREEEREIQAAKYIYRTRNGIITEKSLAAGQFDFNDYLEKLGQFIDMINYNRLPEDIKAVKSSANGEEIRLGNKDSLSTFYQIFFLATPESLDKEVMVIRQQDGVYYGDAALFPQLKSALDSYFDGAA